MESKKQKTKIKVTLDNYSKLAMSTCLPSAKNLQYAFTNFYAEVYECLGKVYGLEAKKIRDNLSEEEIAEKIKEIKKEIGDIFWQLNLYCVLKKCDFKKLYKLAKLDKNIKNSSSLNLQSFLSGYFVTINEDKSLLIIGSFLFLKIICYKYNLSPIACMQQNIIKLKDRQARDKLKGSGDNR